MYKISVVTVTYGKRWHFLSQVLTSVKDNPLVVDIVVVDNGSKEDIESLCKTLNSNKIFVVRTGRNLGSAGGFKIGIETAYKREKGNFIFLLDDDNMPETDCIQNLIDSYIELGSDATNCLKALKVNNLSEEILCKVHWLDLENSFMNFHLWWKFKNFFAKGGSKELSSLMQVRGVAYSGFLFHIDWINKIGFPDEELVLYGDDTEYSLRFIYNGARIFLCKNCKLKDLDVSWHHKNFKGNAFLSPDSDLIKAFYGVRNRAYVEKKYLVKRKFVYFFNFFIYSVYIIIKTLWFEKDKIEVLRRIKLFFIALNDGWKEKLGFKYNLDDLKL